MIVNENVTVNVTIQARPMILATLSDNPPQLFANVSDIRAEGTQRVVYTYRLPSGVSQDEVQFISVASGTAVDVEVARFLSRKVEIRGEFQGSVAEGYLAGDKDDFLFSPVELTISGRAEQVNQVAYAKVIVPGEDLMETVNNDYPFQLIGASGDPLDLDVSCDVDTIYTTFPIRATAEIPLEIKLVEGGGLKERDVSIVPSAESIMVAGTREAVTALANEGAITFTIDLATLEDDTIEYGGERTFPIPLPDELENLSGFSEITATLKVRKRVETRSFDVTSRISAINVPEGWKADIITQVLPVKVRGTKALLDELTEESVQVVADLQDINLSAGPHTVQANVRLYSTGSVSDVGVVNPSSYTIVVSLTQEG